MSQDRSIDLIWALGALVLVGSALMARQLPAGRALRLAAIWAAIFAAALLLATLLLHLGLHWPGDEPRDGTGHAGEQMVSRAPAKPLPHAPGSYIMQIIGLEG